VSKKVAILYGVLGGTLRSRRFRQELRLAGYSVVSKVSDADIVIAHSAGNFSLPQVMAGKKLLLIDPPYWPEKTVRERMRNRMRRHTQSHQLYGYSRWYVIKFNLVSWFYMLTNPLRQWRIYKYAHVFNLPDVLHDQQGILVRNEDDDWLTPEAHVILHENPNIKLVTMPNDHDHLWYNPRPYVELLKQL